MVIEINWVAVFWAHAYMVYYAACLIGITLLVWAGFIPGVLLLGCCANWLKYDKFAIPEVKKTARCDYRTHRKCEKCGTVTPVKGFGWYTPEGGRKRRSVVCKECARRELR